MSEAVPPQNPPPEDPSARFRKGAPERVSQPPPPPPAPQGLPAAKSAQTPGAPPPAAAQLPPSAAPQDPAARFAKPKPAAAPAPAKQAPPAPAPSFGELFESSAMALVNAPGTFAALAARPAPNGAGPLFLALAWGAAFFAINLVHVQTANPAALKLFPPEKIAMVAALALGVWAGLYLLGAAILFGLGRALGKEGDFSRALLVATFALAAAPVQALASWMPSAWMLPTFLGAWIAACGLAVFFSANAWAARAVCALFAAGALAVQWGAREFVGKVTAAAQFASAAEESASGAVQLNADLRAMQEQMQKMQEAAASMPQPGQPGQPGQTGSSSLDLLRGPEGGPTAQDAPTQKQVIAQSMAQGDAMNKSVVGMLDSLGPILSNPAITANMSPQQKAEFKELQQLMATMREDMATGKVTTQAQHQKNMAKLQSLMLKVMSSGIAMPPAGGAQPPAQQQPPAPGAGK